MPLANDREGITAWAEELTDAIVARNEFHQVAVLIHDSAAIGLRLVTQRWGPAEDIGMLVPGEWLVPIHGSICGRVYRTGVPALCSDVSLDPDYLSFTGGRTKSELTVPITVDERTVGVVNIEASWPSAFGIVELELVQRLVDEAVESFPVSMEEAAG